MSSLNQKTMINEIEMLEQYQRELFLEEQKVVLQA